MFSGLEIHLDQVMCLLFLCVSLNLLVCLCEFLICWLMVIGYCKVVRSPE